jgi:hypothetical protein
MSDEMPPVRDVDPKETPFELVTPTPTPTFEPTPYEPPPPPVLEPLPTPNPRPRLPEPGFDAMPADPINTFVCTNPDCPMYEVVGLNYFASITQPLCGGCSEPTEERPV